MNHKEVVESIGGIVLMPCNIVKANSNWDGEGVYVEPIYGETDFSYFIPKKKTDLDKEDHEFIAQLLPESKEMKEARIQAKIDAKQKEIEELQKEIV